MSAVRNLNQNVKKCNLNVSSFGRLEAPRADASLEIKSKLRPTVEKLIVCVQIVFNMSTYRKVKFLSGIK